MISIKLSIAGAPKDIALAKFLGTDDNSFENCHFAINAPLAACDYWFVLDETAKEDIECSARALILLQGEAMWSSGHYADSSEWIRYLSQFDQVYSSQALPDVKAVYCPPFLPWMIDANHGESIFKGGVSLFEKYQHDPYTEKRHSLSVICSTKKMTEGHRIRLRFLERLAGDLGDELHWYGNGEREIDTKWPAIAPYRNHLVLENQADAGVYTEKILDSFLGNAFPIYWGAPDLGQYFPEESFLPVNIKDYSGSLDKILSVVSSNENHWDALQEARNLVLGERNMFVRIARIAQRLHSQRELEVRQRRVKPLRRFLKSRPDGVKRLLGR